ncbi:MAG TPA: DNA-binding response regulator [Ruminococcus sp.]|nr:DNA-binding response regulator [Ruminococcus sp.]
MKYQCLMIDDDRTIAETTAEYFNMFDIKTAYVTSYDAAVQFLAEHQVSLLLLDINLGEHSGFALCKQIRAEYDMPILFISARTSDDDILMALHIGGDDYITKPYTLSILLAKVRAILNRYEKAAETAKAVSAGAFSDKPEALIRNGQIRISDGLSLDMKLRKLRKNDSLIALKTMEYKLLLYLLENRGTVITKDAFMKNVWADDYIGEGTISVHIRHLREKIEKDPNAPEIIRTVWGVGYIMENCED